MKADFSFTGNRLDWASQRRSDADWLKARLADPLSRFLPFRDLKPLIDLTPGTDTGPDFGPESGPEFGPEFGPRLGPRLGWRPGVDVGNQLDSGAAWIFLGLEDGAARFAVDLPAAPESGFCPAAGEKFIDLRSIAPQLIAADAALLAQARPLLDWHDRHGYCANCGTRTEARNGGYLRHCPACSSDHFPRTDPVVIMIPVRGARCLLGRNHRFPMNLFSALAGFLEPGETIEEAVRREVLEETGVQVGEVRYLASQPWPFPSSLMIGCLAEALSEEITLDDEELAEARWFTRQELAGPLKDTSDPFTETDLGRLRVTPPFAIGHTLIKAWFDDGD